MAKYIIFTKSNINLNKTYFQNERRGQKAHEIETREEVREKIKELTAKGETIVEICTNLGTRVAI